MSDIKLGQEFNYNPPAFPPTKPLDSWGDPNQGMSLRDWFAGQALMGLVNQYHPDGAARSEVAYEYAAAIRARGET